MYRRNDLHPYNFCLYQKPIVEKNPIFKNPDLQFLFILAKNFGYECSRHNNYHSDCIFCHQRFDLRIDKGSCGNCCHTCGSVLSCKFFGMAVGLDTRKRLVRSKISRNYKFYDYFPWRYTASNLAIETTRQICRRNKPKLAQQTGWFRFWWLQRRTHSGRCMLPCRTYNSEFQPY